MDQDQTAPVGAVWSGSTMFASMLMLNRHFQMLLFLLAFKGQKNLFCANTEVTAQDATVTFE